MMIEKSVFDTNFNIMFVDNQPSMQFPHLHDDIEILINLGGGKNCFVEDILYQLRPHDIIIFGRNQIHHVLKDPEQSFRRYIIIYKESYLMSLSDEYLKIKSMLDNMTHLKHNFLTLSDSAWDTLIEKLNFYFSISGLYSQLRKIAAFLDILLFVLEHYIVKDSFDSKWNCSNIQSIIDTIGRDYLRGDFSLDVLAKNVHLNKSYMCEVFKKHTGFTIAEYINQKRIKAARQLLIQGCSVTECAEQTGYLNYNTFIRVFKKISGTTPKKYSILKTTEQ